MCLAVMLFLTFAYAKEYEEIHGVKFGAKTSEIVNFNEFQFINNIELEGDNVALYYQSNKEPWHEIMLAVRDDQIISVMYSTYIDKDNNSCNSMTERWGDVKEFLVSGQIISNVSVSINKFVFKPEDSFVKEILCMTTSQANDSSKLTEVYMTEKSLQIKKLVL